MTKPVLLLVHPGQDKDRFGLRRRRKSSIPKLNLPLLAAHADDRFDVRIVDESIEDIDFDASADLVGITLITQVAARGYAIADEFRRRGKKVVLGGFHVFFYPEEAEAHADAIVIGEAEGVWDQLLADFLDGRLAPRYQAAAPHNLVGLPRPRLDLLKRGAYSFYNVVETSRGCPHRCSYCAVTRFWGHRFRFRPVGEVVDEVRALPPGPVVFVDDNIVGSPRRAKELFQALIPLGRKWYGQADIKIAKDPKLLELAARSGARWLFVGVESVNTDNLTDVGKERINVAADYAQSLDALRRAGIQVLGSFIFGFDRDDRSVFDQTVQFCVDNRLGAVNFYLLTPMPFTDLFTEMDRAGRILHRDWSKYDMNHVVFQPAKMTPEELLEGYLAAYRSVYSFGAIARRVGRPGRGLGQLLALNLGRRLNIRFFEYGCRT